MTVDMSDQTQDVESDCDSLFNSPPPKRPARVRWKHPELLHYFPKRQSSVCLTGMESEGHEASRITARPKQASSQRHPSALAAGLGEGQSSKVRNSSSCTATAHRELDQSRGSPPLAIKLHSSPHAGPLTTSAGNFIKQQDSLGILPQSSTMFNYSSDEDDDDQHLAASRFRFDSLGDCMKGGASPTARLVPLEDPRQLIATSLQTGTPSSAEASGMQEHRSSDHLNSPSAHKKKRGPFDEERSSGDDEPHKFSTQLLGLSPSTMHKLCAAGSHNNARSTAMSKSAALREQTRRVKAGLASPAMSTSKPLVVHGLQHSDDFDRSEVAGGGTKAQRTQAPRTKSDADEPKGETKPKLAVGDGEGPSGPRSVTRVGSAPAVQIALTKGPIIANTSPASQGPTVSNSPSRLQTQHVKSHSRVQNQVSHSRISKDARNSASGTPTLRSTAPVTGKRQLNTGLLKDKLSRPSPQISQADKPLPQMVRRDTSIASTLAPTKAQHVVEPPANALRTGSMSSTKGRIRSPMASNGMPRQNTIATITQTQDAKKLLFAVSHVELNAMGNEVQSGRRFEAHQVQILNPPNPRKVEELCIPLSNIRHPKPKSSHVGTSDMSKGGNTESHSTADRPNLSSFEANNTSGDIPQIACNSDSCRYDSVFGVRGGQSHRHANPADEAKWPSFDPASMSMLDSTHMMEQSFQSKHKLTSINAQAGIALEILADPKSILTNDSARRGLMQENRSDASKASSPEARNVSLEQLDGEARAKAAGGSNGTLYLMNDASHVCKESQADKAAVNNTLVSIHANEQCHESTASGCWECMEKSTEFSEERWDNSNSDNRTELAHKPAKLEQPEIVGTKPVAVMTRLAPTIHSVAKPGSPNAILASTPGVSQQNFGSQQSGITKEIENARTVRSSNKQNSEAALFSARFPPTAQIIRQSSSSAASPLQEAPITKATHIHCDSITASNAIYLGSNQGSDDPVSFLTDNQGDLQDAASRRPAGAEKASEDQLEAGKAKEKMLPFWATEEALQKLPRDFRYLFDLVEIEKLGFDKAVVQFNRERAQAKDRRTLYQQYREELSKAGISKPGRPKTSLEVKASVPASKPVKGSPIIKAVQSPRNSTQSPPASPSRDHGAFFSSHDSDAPHPPGQSIPAPASSDLVLRSPLQKLKNSLIVSCRACDGPVAVSLPSQSTRDCVQQLQPTNPPALPRHAQRKRALNAASLPEAKKARVEVDSKSRAVAGVTPQTGASGELPIEAARSEATDEESGFEVESDTEDSIDETDSELDQYDADGNGAQFFQYKVFYKCWTEGEDDADIERSLWSNGEFESLRRANKFAHGRKKYVDTHKLVRFTDWTRSKDKDDVESYLGKFVDHQNRIGYYKIWTERWLVRKSDRLLPRSKGGFLRKHVFIMRMFRLLQEPDDEHPHTQPIREHYEITSDTVYTVLHYANKKAMEIQLSMSVVEGKCRYKLDEKHRQKQVKELGDKLRNLDAKEECWHSQFRALSKWSNAMFEIQVQKASLTGPRNI